VGAKFGVGGEGRAMCNNFFDALFFILKENLLVIRKRARPDQISWTMNTS
jgi:hypothetical protein